MKTNIIVNGVHKCLQDTFNEAMRNTIEKNPSIDTEEAEELRFDKLELDTDQRSRHIDVWLA